MPPSRAIDDDMHEILFRIFQHRTCLMNPSFVIVTPQVHCLAVHKCQFCLSEGALSGACNLQTLSLSLSLSELGIELFVKVQ